MPDSVGLNVLLYICPIKPLAIGEVQHSKGIKSAMTIVYVKLFYQISIFRLTIYKAVVKTETLSLWQLGLYLYYGTD